MNALLSNRKANGACVRDSAINTDNATRVPYQQAERLAYHLDRRNTGRMRLSWEERPKNLFSYVRIAVKWLIAHKEDVEVYNIQHSSGSQYSSVARFC
jgi:hypothetical protein